MSKKELNENLEVNNEVEVEQENQVETEVKQTNQVEKKDKKQTSKKNKKEAKPRSNKFKEMVSELKKVSWPKFSEVVKKTGIVLVVVAFFFIVLFGIDWLLSLLYSLLTKAM